MAGQTGQNGCHITVSVTWLKSEDGWLHAPHRASCFGTPYNEANMQLATEERRRWRREYVDQFLNENGLVRDRLATSTEICLDEWARQVKLVQDQPSSSFGNVVIQLCKAVESELASGLGTIEALSLLGTGTLGQKAKYLAATELDHSSRQRLESRGIKPGFVRTDLPELLYSLARLRSNTDAAHGNADICSADAQDGARARELAGRILRGIAASPKGCK